ncbi:sigma-54-dependent Fis family transcriptional regulator [Pedobacter sp. BMA]|uniref:sigma-54 interaction domain-containing protein n=1 Tax=Pedobacter sp. BMA TaxID=1663685 RepID=UPI00069E4E3B|nr:sigma-54 dependent transcriptional regulator [Pedobacter sp. BMA]
MKNKETDFNSAQLKKNEVEHSSSACFKELAGAVPEQEKHFSLKDLFLGIFSKLHPLFSIDCGALVLYNDDKDHITRAYLTEAVAGKVTCTETITDPVSLSLISQEIAGFDFPVIKSRQDWIDDFGENHCLINHPTEYHFHCYIPLENAGKILGTFELHNHNRELSREGLTFCCNIADFVAGLLSVIARPDQQAADNVSGSSKGHDVSGLLLQYEEKIRNLERETESLSEALAEFIPSMPSEENAIYQHPKIVGVSAEMQVVYRLLNRISGSETTVLILGETGTGKELFAKAIHEESGRSQKPLIKVNCAAIPPNLIESELFGHEKGSFTGATERRIGKFEQANKGTIFLDEVGELPLDLQVKLLRVLQEKEIERVGGKTTIPVDVRIISATNRNLLEEVEAGNFRRDLYYRLNVFPLLLPPLRSRKSDIQLLACFFLERFSEKSHRPSAGFSKKAISTLTAYSWPGNVRELEHVIEREAVMAQGAMIRKVNIPGVTDKSMPAIAGVKTIFENERDHIFAVLELCGGKISGQNGAAKLLGVPATTLNSKMKRLGLLKKHVL